MAVALDLALLRTAKQAVEEGLLNDEDYDDIKKAFLRATQIKVGLDAGFIKEEDYRQARDSFLHSLDFKLVGAVPHAHPPPAPPQQQQQSAFAAGAVPLPPSQQHTSAAPPPPPAASASRPAPAPPPLRSVFSNGEAAAQRSNGGPGTVPVPTDLPASRPRGASMAIANKTSMSGICVNDQCVNVYNVIKTRSAYKWVTYKVNDAGNEVIIDQLGASNSTYDQFLSTLPENNCRYGVYDYAYLNNDTNQTINKLVFLHWAPDGSTTKHKMMYASTKDFLKNYLDGLGAELQATEVGELAEAEMRERVHQAITRK